MEKLFFKKKWKIWIPSQKNLLKHKKFLNIKNNVKVLSKNQLIKKDINLINQSKCYQNLKTIDKLGVIENFEQLKDISYKQYLKEEKEIGYIQGIKEGKEIGYIQGIKEGKEIGYIQGIKEGKEIGYIQGIKEGKEIGYITGLKKNLINFKKNNYDVQNKLKYFLKSFERSLHEIDTIISHRLLKVVFKVTSNFFDNIKLVKNNNILLNNINKVINKYLMFTKFLQLHINPKDEEIIKKHFRKIIKKYKWDIFCNTHIIRGGCKIVSKYAIFDNTLPTYWKELCKTIVIKSTQ